MNLKTLINRKKILNAEAVGAELTLEGEPLIYSFKYDINNRKFTTNYFRNNKWKSMIKCFFNSCLYVKTPVVISVRFYVSPPLSVDIRASDLRRECVPATKAFEVCDYLLSFMEMLHGVLVCSYRQIVKLDVEKWYSSNPRTVFKFMRWDHYVQLQNNHTDDSSAKSFCKACEARTLLQSEPQGDATNQDSSEEVSSRGVQDRKSVV